MKKLAGKADFLIHFKKFLFKAHSEHKLVFLIVDDAQTLNHDRLEEIRIFNQH